MFARVLGSLGALESAVALFPGSLTGMKGDGKGEQSVQTDMSFG